MSDRILMASSLAEPDPAGSNNTMTMQVHALQKRGADVEILTWPIGTLWKGPMPDGAEMGGMPYRYSVYHDLKYHIVMPPHAWSRRVLNEDEWEAAVSYSMKILEQIKPSLVHLQFWQRLWWVVAAAQRLGIPTVYSAHDFGIACLRTVLLTGDERVCDGTVSVDKCSKCILSGRNIVGSINEAVAAIPGAELILNLLYGREKDGFIARSGGERMNVRRRVALTIERNRAMFERIDAVIASNPLAALFFRQFGVAENKSHMFPWFSSSRSKTLDLPPFSEGINIGVVSRISPEKGIHLLLDALAEMDSRRPVTLHIAGALDSAYARKLHKKYSNRAGRHAVVWRGWIPNAQLSGFYTKMHVMIVPSLCCDNSPLTLSEALAHGRPVICTDVPSMTHLVKNGINGLVFPLANKDVLKRHIQRLADNPELISAFSRNSTAVLTAEEYAGKLIQIYDTVLSSTRTDDKGVNA